MSRLTVTLACREYDHTRALIDGKVAIEGVDLKCVSISPPSQIFLRMLRDEEFDASEMSLSNYMIALGSGDRRFVGIPVFPSRVFRHSNIWINANSGIRTPRDLIGSKVGIPDYSMTALLFIRGMLEHQYGSRRKMFSGFVAGRSMSLPGSRQTSGLKTSEKIKLWMACSNRAGWMRSLLLRCRQA